MKLSVILAVFAVPCLVHAQVRDGAAVSDEEPSSQAAKIGVESAAAPEETPPPQTDQAETPEEEQRRKTQQERLLWRPLAVSEERAAGPLASLALSADPVSRMRAIEGLVAVNSPEMIPFVVYELSDPEPAVRKAALNAIPSLERATVSEAILAVLAWGDAEIVKGVTAALPSLRPVLEEAFLKALDNSELTQDERVGAAYALGRMGSIRALEPLEEKVYGSDARLSAYAADAIAAMDNAGTLQTLMRMVQHTDPNVRLPAYQGIARIGGPEALGLLTAAASPGGEPDIRVKREVVRSLGLVGNESTVHFLIKMVRARSSLTRPAIESLSMMTGLPASLAPERWVEWYEEAFPPEMEESTVPAPPLVPVGGAP